MSINRYPSPELVFKKFIFPGRCYKILVFSLDFSPSVLAGTTLLSMEGVSLSEEELKFSPFS